MTDQEWKAENSAGLLSGLKAYTPCNRVACAAVRSIWHLADDDMVQAVLGYETDHGPTAVMHLPHRETRSFFISDPDDLTYWLRNFVGRFPGQAGTILAAVRDAVVPPIARSQVRGWDVQCCPRCDGTSGHYRGDWPRKPDDPLLCYRCPGDILMVAPRLMYRQFALDVLGEPRTLDPVGLSALADVLEENECHWQALLDHLREPGSHGLYCWVLSLLDPPPTPPATGRGSVPVTADLGESS